MSVVIAVGYAGRKDIAMRNAKGSFHGTGVTPTTFTKRSAFNAVVPIRRTRWPNADRQATEEAGLNHRIQASTDQQERNGKYVRVYAFMRSM